MRRADRQQDLEFSLNLIDRCPHGVIALNSGEDTPYCLPLSFVRKGNSLYFHCALEGRKVDRLRKNPRVCITFVGQDDPAFLPPDMYTTYFQSVIVTGTAREVTEEQEMVEALRLLCEKLLPAHMGGSAFQQAISASLKATAIWCIEMDQITGKAKLKK